MQCIVSLLDQTAHIEPLFGIRFLDSIRIHYLGVACTCLSLICCLPNNVEDLYFQVLPPHVPRLHLITLISEAIDHRLDELFRTPFFSMGLNTSFSLMNSFRVECNVYSNSSVVKRKISSERCSRSFRLKENTNRRFSA